LDHSVLLSLLLKKEVKVVLSDSRTMDVPVKVRGLHVWSADTILILLVPILSLQLVDVRAKLINHVN